MGVIVSERHACMHGPGVAVTSYAWSPRAEIGVESSEVEDSDFTRATLERTMAMWHFSMLPLPLRDGQ